MEERQGGGVSLRFRSAGSAARNRHLRPARPAVSQEVSVPSNGNRDVELDLTLERRPTGGSAQGLVTDLAGKPIVARKLSNMGNSSNAIRETMTNGAGRFVIDDLFTSFEGCRLVVRDRLCPAGRPRPAGAGRRSGRNHGEARTGTQNSRPRRERRRSTDRRGLRQFYRTGDQGIGAGNIGSYIQTDAQGRFQFDSLPADCPFRIRAKGYSPLQDQKLELDGDEEVVVTMPSQGIVRGRVLDAASGTRSSNSGFASRFRPIVRPVIRRAT